MREIKFRMWDDEEKIMIDGDSLAFEEYLPIKDLLSQDYIMQFTGLHDKNGKEIYEGDILKSEEYDEAGINCGHIFVVEWFQDDIYCGWNIARSDCWSAKVIGNIYENSELIK